MNVITKHCRNPDIIGGYWQPPVNTGRAIPVHIENLDHASNICREYIERNGLGGGNWSGGDVYDNGKAIAYVSFNGRTWPPREKNVLKLPCAS